MDPLTWDFPDLTNYQYASDEPIANVDMDGLEKQIITYASKAAQQAGDAVFTTTLHHAEDVVITTAAKKAAQKVGGQIIKEAFRVGGKTLLKGIGLTIYFTLKPLDAGPRLGPEAHGNELYYMQQQWKKYPYKPKPKTDEDDEQRYLYRFDTRSPDEIAKDGGFKSWGNNYSIPDHVSGKSIRDKTSAYVSTSKTRAGALDLWKGRKDGYLYKIKYQVTGIDVSNISPFPQQEEIAVPKMIPVTDIKGVETFSKLK